MPGVGAIVLAAGGSSRMGTPKQLLIYEGQTFLRRAVENVVAAGCDPAVAVLGSGAREMAGQLADLPITSVVNPEWERGMGTSLRAGLRQVLTLQPTVEAVVVLLVDQPLVTMRDIVHLVEAWRSSRKGVAVSRSYGALGPPVCAGRMFFQHMLALPDECGARSIWRAHPEDVLEVPCEAAAEDIDTPGDYKRLGKE